jgi:hypothetical protein
MQHNPFRLIAFDVVSSLIKSYQAVCMEETHYCIAQSRSYKKQLCETLFTLTF